MLPAAHHGRFLILNNAAPLLPLPPLLPLLPLPPLLPLLRLLPLLPLLLPLPPLLPPLLRRPHYHYSLQVVYILDQVRALEQEMRRRLEEQGLPDIKPNIMVVTRLIPSVSVTPGADSCGWQL